MAHAAETDVPRSRRSRRRRSHSAHVGIVGLAGVWLVWLAFTAVLVLHIGEDLFDYGVGDGDFGCAVPGPRAVALSITGKPSWSVWSPGEICTYHGRVFQRPGATRGWLTAGVVTGLAGLMLATAATAKRDRRAGGE